MATEIRSSGAIVPVVKGELVRIDIRRLKCMATPKLRADEGQGQGVPPAVLLELLDELTQSLRDGEDEHDSLRWALKMLLQLLTRQESSRSGAARALTCLMEQVGEVKDQDVLEDLETLRLCVQPIDRVWMGS